MINLALAPILLGCQFCRPDSLSNEGLEMDSCMAESAIHFRKSITFGSHWSQSIGHLIELAEETSSPNWDGYDADPLSPEVFDAALKFLTCLPFDLPEPEIGATSSGEISFEWCSAKYRILSVGISSNGELHFASLIGLKRLFGTMPVEDVITSRLFDLAREVTSRA